MSQIEIKHLWKHYGHKPVLENLSLTVEKGEFVSIVGASGCGKTTFFRMLLGEEQPTRGSMTLDGQPWPGEPDADRGVVFQRYSVFPHLTALANVRAALDFAGAPILGRLMGAAKREANDRAMAMLESVGLAGARDKYPHELSGGMQQRLAIAQALVRHPGILLLDEPFGALDPGIRHDMHELMQGLWQKHGFTVFMVTHDIKEGFTLGTRMLVFDRVRVDAQAPDAYGATITYDLPLKNKDLLALAELRENVHTRVPLERQAARPGERS
ncbi:MAG: transporter ATP-binding protein [Moraxellaceae bacterium]|jgi:NitT/TauT family transport system ATP-binding protein|nr:transporter ATP-binding protein [Moraxellaceae bacterium]